MATYHFEPLTQANAVTIADRWHYPVPYDFYDMTADVEDYEELIDPQQRGTAYHQATDEKGQLVGFWVLMATDEPGTVELGLGLAPALTGGGRGEDFLQQILTHLRCQLAEARVVLDVAAFNVRAQKVYARAGFRVTGRHQQATNGGVYPFITMARQL
ncbi:GNAT family N-acetyltransferase [Lacticaseibacillus daqingensis]|uniref:GNAT family N-acetyltransferase n=1 Tax=Lacticaseibacillus daqingensis TaxID=2486014 RepID=UPI000F791A87|nr:GNAT family protein [Lacticaseibacillus daqingensis]